MQQDWLDVPKRLGSPDNDRENLSGGPDLDTVRRRAPDVVEEAEGGPSDKEPQNPRLADERSGAPAPTAPPDPSGDDPFVAGAPDDSDGVELGSGERNEPQPQGDGPEYEHREVG